MSTKIEWCMNPDVTPGETWNPVVGCSKISEGCLNCYASKQIHRNLKVSEMVKMWKGYLHVIEHKLSNPLHWNKPRTIFVGSMTDMFHENMPYKILDLIMSVIEQCPQHTFIFLTKRPKNMRQYFANGQNQNIFGNMILGITVENQTRLEERLPPLLDIPAQIRFVSVEPMLGYISLPGPCVDWVICGAETGHNARPLNYSWVIKLSEQCEYAEVPFFFKKWGKYVENRFGENDKFDHIIPDSWRQFPKLMKFEKGC